MPEGVFENHPKDHRFTLAIDSHVAFANYRQENQEILIDHVEAPPALRGTGAAGNLMRGVMEYAQENGLSVTPICGYAKAWMQKNGYLPR